MTEFQEILLVLISILLNSVHAKDPWWLKVARKQGPMVCATEYIDEYNRYFSTPWTGGNFCGSESIIRYSCCYGCSHVPGERGCPLVKPLKNLAETAKDAGAKRFIQQAEQSALLPLLSDRGAYTVFAAKDSAFLSLTKEQEKALNSSKRSRSRPPALLYTIAEGRIPAEDLPDSLTTLYREGSVFITKFPNGLTTVNCIPLTTTNLEATNGLIHLTESLLLPTGRNTVPDVLVRVSSLSTTATTLVRAQLANELRDKKPVTIFAPTDQAWESLPSGFMEALMEDPSSLKVLLQYHVVDGIWCSSVISGESEIQTLEGGSLRISCNSSGQYVNNARIIRGDHTAGNGFVHHIDSVLVPERVLSIAEYLETRNTEYFLKLAELGGILPFLQRPEAYTAFVPEDEAFEALPNETLSDMLNDTVLARAIVSFHIVANRQFTTNFIDGQKFPTVKGPTPPLRIKIHKKRVTVEDALVNEADLQTRNGVLHVIDRVLFPPTVSLLEQLQEGNYSMFVSLLNQTQPNLLKTLDNSSATFTVFALNDAAMNQTLLGTVPRLLADPPLLYKVMASHILPVFVISNSLEPGLMYSYKTLNNQSITFMKETDGSLTIARLAQVTLPDLTATNGVLHEISRLLLL